MPHSNSSRKLTVLQGDASILFEQLSPIVTNYPADWLTVTTSSNLPQAFTHCILPNKARSLFGREFKHAIFDATLGFHLDAFAALTGSLIKGSLLILLLPKNLTSWKDNDSLRWNENSNPITVPNFIYHLIEQLKQIGISVTEKVEIHDIDTMLNHQPLYQQTINPIDEQEQKNVLMQLQQSNKPIIALIAKRGRGKSALAGLFTHNHDCAVTAPNKESLSSFLKFAKHPIDFYSPDDLVLSNFSRLPDYLIIDEAAMIPLSVLEKLLNLPTRIFLTTTVEGYEGTGQGFSLKLLKNKKVDYFYLTKPIRWQDNDELEYFTEQLLLEGSNNKHVEISINTQTEFINYSSTSRIDINRLKAIYHLLKMAHYRTTPTDLRRLLDAENTLVWQANQGDNIVGALIAINEGGLSDNLIGEVWNGTRRPKGNLVAQSLVAHAGEKLAAKLHSIRINRIAVQESYRRQKIAKQLVKHLKNDAENQKKDYLSVSFSHSIENEQFWSACGFTFVHVASHKEASSGNYSVMAIKAISEEGNMLVTILHKQLQRNWYWLSRIIDLKLSIEIDCDQQLSNQDQQLLQGFALHYRPYEATYAALCRLNNAICRKLVHNKNTNLMLPIFLALITQQKSIPQTVKKYQLSGRQALINKLKQEVDFLLTNYF